MVARSKTKPSTPRLSDLARHVVLPSGVVSTGWPAVVAKCADLGIEFDEWQHGAGKVILAKRANGQYAATIGGTALSIPRQVGKTFLVGAIVFALCLLNPGLTVIWTAHRLRTAGETFEKMRGMAQRKLIRPHIAKIILGSGEEEVRFTNGSRILFGARERGFGRGFDEVDVLIFDEAQILTENAIDDMVPATNQSRQPTGALMLFMGTPPKPTDPGEVFTRMREEALSGEDEDTGYIEFSADPDFVPSETPAPMTPEDWKQIGKANPSHPKRTPREAVLRMRKKLTAESMNREGYGIWDETSALGVFGPSWLRRTSLEEPGLPACLAVAADPDAAWLSLGAVSVDEVPHGGLVQRVRVDDEAQAAFVAEVKRLQDEYHVPVVVGAKGPAGFLIDVLEDAGVEVTSGSFEDFVQASADIFTAVRDAKFCHGDYPDLNDAARASGWRKYGERRVLALRGGDIDALEAVAWALWGRSNAVYELEPTAMFV